MDIKIVKEKNPEVKIKKEAEVSIHKKNLISARTEGRTVFHVKDSSDFLGNKKPHGKDLGEKNPLAESQAGKKARETGVQKRTGRNGTERNGKGSPQAYQKNAAAAMKKTETMNPKNHNIPMSDREKSLPAGDAAVPVSSETMQKAGVLTNREAKKNFKQRKKIASLSGTPKIHPGKNEIAIKGVKQGGKAILTQLDGGDEANEALAVMAAANRPFRSIGEKRKYAKAEERLKIKQADQKISSKQLRKELQKKKKGIAEKQNNQAVRQRKMQYIINKLTGSGV